ncbi:hypothetical protein B2H94_10025 [Clostridium sporogenes]|uniref:Uncharacterized protein n=1 Tax=Clostridium sporogenes TaxID=1509 RepID=A0ABD6RV83_CLOSG|nr:hypothetical protein B2H94_10025 [Clostridium sporogenes]
MSATFYYFDFIAFIDADIIYSPTFKLCPHFSAYSFDTSLVSILISLKPAFSKYNFNSSTEDAPVTHPQ